MGSESQSRYSIVERLTEKKLSIMDEKQQIEGKIQGKKTEIEQYKNQIEVEKRESQEKLKTDIEMYEQRIKRLEQEIAQEEKGKGTKSALCDEKIKQIDIALKAVQDISESSAKEASK